MIVAPDARYRQSRALAGLNRLDHTFGRPWLRWRVSGGLERFAPTAEVSPCGFCKLMVLSIHAMQ
jgi:hypothetical protein